MEEIKVGLYGRTNLGNIIKFAYFCDENNERYTNKVILIDEVTKSSRPYYYFKEDERIVKESKNIIDLIEVGDYVNGKLINSISRYQGEKVVCYSEETGGGISYHIFEKYIKSIVTKEQFENIEYRLED